MLVRTIAEYFLKICLEYFQIILDKFQKIQKGLSKVY
jgi:hypothetical protein